MCFKLNKLPENSRDFEPGQIVHVLFGPHAGSSQAFARPQSNHKDQIGLDWAWHNSLAGTLKATLSDITSSIRWAWFNGCPLRDDSIGPSQIADTVRQWALRVRPPDDGQSK